MKEKYSNLLKKNLKLTKTRYFKRNVVIELTYQLKFPENIKINTCLKIIKYALKYVKKSTHGGDLGRILIKNEDLDNTLIVPLQDLATLTIDTVTQTCERLAQSARSFNLQNSELIFSIYQFPKIQHLMKNKTQRTKLN